MKNIAVLIYDITIEYHVTLTDGILGFLDEKKDVNVLIAPVNAPHSSQFDCSYINWTTIELLKSKTIDAVIVVVNSFSRDLSPDQLANEISKLVPKPIISISVPLNLSTNIYTVISPKKAYTQIVEHLVKKHNKTKIAYFSASLTHSPESAERVKAFKEAIKENGLEFHKEWVYPGDFTPALSHRYITQNFTSIEDIPFDAILCANDYTAQGVISALTSLGVKVPEDICVFGFDDSDVSRSEKPSISTVNQHLYMSGYKAAELAYKATFGKKVPKKAYIDCIPVYRQSCGCIPLDLPASYYLNGEEELVKEVDTNTNVLNLFGNALNDLSTIYYLLYVSEAVITLKDYFTSLRRTMDRIFSSFIALCLYPKEIELEQEDDFVLSDKAKLFMLIDTYRDIEKIYPGGGIVFNPLESLLPESFDETRKRNYYLFPISLGKKLYGYTVFEVPNQKYTICEIYMKILTGSFVHALEYSRIENQNERLEVTNTTDELTKLYNRRGFMNFAQKALDFARETKKTGSIIFFDMDGLKIINDTYGHKSGDVAIQSTGEVLREAFHKSDLVAHLSGDEFAVMAMGFAKENMKIFRERIETLFQKKKEEKNLPFNLSASIGIAEYNAENTDLQKLLMIADQEMYVEKKAKHDARRRK